MTMQVILNYTDLEKTSEKEIYEFRNYCFNLVAVILSTSPFSTNISLIQLYFS